jgi:hypothetical protein
MLGEKGSVQIRDRERRKREKALGAFEPPRLAVVRKSEIFVITEDRRSSERRASAAMQPVVLASSGFVESASPFQSARSRLTDRQELTR